jgi:oligopeptide/dipeptide ABC transporter ATP-binding protein
MPVLRTQDLRVRFGSSEILRGVSLDLERGETLGVVGESGCGKSMTGLALMGMVPAPGVVSGSIRLDNQELVGQSECDWQRLRGAQIAMVMQDPFSSLNPVMRVGDQIGEVLRLHRGMNRRDAFAEAVQLIGHVGIPDPERSARKFPHQMSGGQRQRVVIAIAFACKPTVLIADEPTTALDVTIQAQILDLLRTLQREQGTAVMLVSHDIGVIASEAARIAVFYAGRVVETGPTRDVLRDPQHPYTRALIEALPRLGVDRLTSIAGQPPRFDAMPTGCAFAARCDVKFDRCTDDPALEIVGPARECACWRATGVVV